MKLKYFFFFTIRHTSKSRAQFTNCTYYMSFLQSFEALLTVRRTHKPPASVADMFSASYGCLLKGATIKPVSSEPLLNSHPLLGSDSLTKVLDIINFPLIVVKQFVLSCKLY